MIRMFGSSSRLDLALDNLDECLGVDVVDVFTSHG
jgi:hypothetical protein